MKSNPFILKWDLRFEQIYKENSDIIEFIKKS